MVLWADASSGEAALGNVGLVVWDSTGQRVWQNEKYSIYDCYAINIDEMENLWFYYYDDFNLVCTDFKKDLVCHPEIRGMDSFLLTKGNQILCGGGYNKHGQFIKIDILSDFPSAYFSSSYAFSHHTKYSASKEDSGFNRTALSYSEQSGGAISTLITIFLRSSSTPNNPD